MTVSQMEEITGLTRANIRFYEAQGLLAPARQENRYREYTDEHAAVLLRIKLLRTLGMSIEQIKALQNGEDNMIAALDRQIIALQEQQTRIGNAQRVCREMRDDGISYATLDAARYLKSLENPPRKPSEIVAQDVAPMVFAPWRRFWARMFDTFVYTMILYTASAWLLGGRIVEWSGIVSTILGFAMTLVLEPIQLRLFGTTLGKWLFGIRVTDCDGGRLSLSDGFWRTVHVIIYGEGLGIGLINLWRYWRSYQMYSNREFLPWEDRSECTVKDTNGLRYLAAVVAAVAIFCASIGLTTLAKLPEHRGELTVAAFCENYRKVAAQDGIDMDPWLLADDGTWTEHRQPNVGYVDLSANSKPLDMVFTTESGVVTSVTISEEISGSVDGMISGRQIQLRMMALAMLMAREDYSIFRGDEGTILTLLSESNFQSFSHTQNGLRFSYRVTHTGYWTASGLLIEDDDPNTESHYSMTFTVEVIQ